MALTKISRSLLDTGVSDSSDATAITIDSSENCTFTGTTTTTGYVISNNTALYDDHSTLSAYSDTNGVYLNGKNAGWLALSGDGTQRNNIRIYGQASSTGEIIQFKTANSERMRIDSSGNVGIGTTSPANSSGYSTLTLNDTTGGQILFQVGGSTLSGIGGTSALDLTAVGNRNIEFNTNGSERMRIDGSGNLLVGTTSAISSSHTIVKDSGNPLNLKRTTDASSQNAILMGYGTGGNTANIQIRGNGDVRNTNGTFTTISSDRRTKENIADATGKLADLCKLNVRNFYYKDQPQEGKQIGFIADEMIDIFPSLVTEEDTREYDADGNVIKGYEDQKGIKVGGIGFAILTKAIQELTAKVEELESKINE